MPGAGDEEDRDEGQESMDTKLCPSFPETGGDFSCPPLETSLTDGFEPSVLLLEVWGFLLAWSTWNTWHESKHWQG